MWQLISCRDLRILAAKWPFQTPVSSSKVSIGGILVLGRLTLKWWPWGDWKFSDTACWHRRKKEKQGLVFHHWFHHHLSLVTPGLRRAFFQGVHRSLMILIYLDADHFTSFHQRTRKDLVCNICSSWSRVTRAWRATARSTTRRKSRVWRAPSIARKLCRDFNMSNGFYLVK